MQAKNYAAQVVTEFGFIYSKLSEVLEKTEINTSEWRLYIAGGHKKSSSFYYPQMAVIY